MKGWRSLETQLTSNTRRSNSDRRATLVQSPRKSNPRKATSQMLVKQASANGVLQSDGGRIFIFDAKAFQVYSKDLRDLMGQKAANELLYRVGLTTARSEYERISGLAKSEDELWRITNKLLQSRGWGHIISRDKVTKGKSLIVKVEYGNSPFADGVTSLDPVCDSMRGLLTGFLESLHGLKSISTTETLCTATGSQFCEFIIDLWNGNRGIAP
jgi:predicted hydrocarbon binding protein